MYGRPNLEDAVDRLAHYLSEIHNDNAPLGWEKYRSLAKSLLVKLPIRDTVMHPLFFNYSFRAEEENGRS